MVSVSVAVATPPPLRSVPRFPWRSSACARAQLLPALMDGTPPRRARSRRQRGERRRRRHGGQRRGPARRPPSRRRGRAARAGAKRLVARGCRRETTTRPDARAGRRDVERRLVGLLASCLGGEGDERVQHGGRATGRGAAGAHRSATPVAADLALVVASRAPPSRTGRSAGASSVMNDSCAIGSPGVELDRDAREVGELERQRALPARVARSRRWRGRSARGGRASTCPRSARRCRRAARPTPACGRGTNSPGWMTNGSSPARHDLLGQVARRVAQVDRRRAVVVEDAERVAQPQVDRRGLHQRGVPRVDRDPALLDEAADRAVGEDGGGVIGRGRPRRRRSRGPRSALGGRARARATAARTRGGGGSGAVAVRAAARAARAAARGGCGRALRPAVAAAGVLGSSALLAWPTRRCSRAPRSGSSATTNRYSIVQPTRRMLPRRGRAESPARARAPGAATRAARTGGAVERGVMRAAARRRARRSRPASRS